MSVGLIVERSDGPSIAISDWRQIVDDDADLRWRTEPYTAANPRTGETIRLALGEADAEICVRGAWFPFLGFRRGRLTTKYQRTFENPQDATRLKIAAVAKRLGAVVTTDAGDDILPW